MGERMPLASEEFEKLALEQLDTLYRVARRLTRDATAAEDLVQETCLRALRGRASFELQEYGIRPWLLRIMHNLHFSRATRDKRQPPSVEQEQLEATAAGEGNDVPLPIGAGSFEGMDEHLVHALDQLPDEYREVMMLWAVEELSYKEIADAVGVPIGTVMSRLHRARKKLADQLRDYATKEGIIRQ